MLTHGYVRREGLVSACDGLSIGVSCHEPPKQSMCFRPKRPMCDGPKQSMCFRPKRCMCNGPKRRLCNGPKRRLCNGPKRCSRVTPKKRIGGRPKQRMPGKRGRRVPGMGKPGRRVLGKILKHRTQGGVLVSRALAQTGEAQAGTRARAWQSSTERCSPRLRGWSTRACLGVRMRKRAAPRAARVKSNVRLINQR